MSFPRAPLTRCNERTVSKSVLKSPSRDKPKTASLGNSRTVSKTAVNKQRSNSSTHHLLDRSRARLGSFSSTLSLEAGEAWRSIRSKSHDKEPNSSVGRVCESISRFKMSSHRPRYKQDSASSSPARRPEVAASDTGGGGGVGSVIISPSNTPSQAMVPSCARQAQHVARRRVLETQFAVKSKRLSGLRKEIMDRQRIMTDLHHSLCEMHERLVAGGLKDLPVPESLPLVEASTLEAAATAAAAAAARDTKGVGRSMVRSTVKGGEGDEDNSDMCLLDDDLMEHLKGPTEEALLGAEAQLRQVPAWCLSACRQALSKRHEVLTWVQELDSAQHLLDEEARRKLDDFKREGEASDVELEAEQRLQLSGVSAAVGALRALATETEAARRDYEQAAAHARAQIAQLGEHQAAQARAHAAAHHDAQQALLDAHAQLKEAQEQCEVQAGQVASAEERVLQLEGQLASMGTQLNAADRRASAAAEEAIAEHERFRIVAEQLNLVDCYLKEERGRVAGLETRLASDEQRIKRFNSQMSALEETLRARDSSHESRLQALHADAQANAEAARRLEAQKDALERRVQDLGALLAGQESGDQKSGQMKEKLDEIRKALEREKDLRMTAQTELEREKLRIAELEGRAGQLTEALRAAGHAADESSAALAQELDTMKKQLRETLMKVASLEDERIIQEESVRKLEMRQVREREEKAAMSAELEEKETALSSAQTQLRELRAKAEAQRDRVLQLERQLSLARTSRPLEHALQQQQQEFQKKVSELQNALKEVVRHNDELERAVVQKQQEVEQRERVMREQAKVLKVRDELIVLLKGKEARQEEAVEALRQQQREHDEALNKAQAETDARIDEVRAAATALETKQLQVTKLEALVKQLEDQQERSQAQRTRQEARISSLEMLLQAQHEPPQRYAPSPRHAPLSRSTPSPPPSPARNALPSSYFFWDGRELSQIERIPAGAQLSPPKGTFYLTVEPKEEGHASPAEGPRGPQRLRFFVTANMGTGDVEEGLGAADAGLKEALARAADAAVACAAFAAVETGRRALEGQTRGEGQGPRSNDAHTTNVAVDGGKTNADVTGCSSWTIQNSRQVSEHWFQPNMQSSTVVLQTDRGSLTNLFDPTPSTLRSKTAKPPESLYQTNSRSKGLDPVANPMWYNEGQKTLNPFLVSAQEGRGQRVRPTLVGVRLRAGASESPPRPASAPAPRTSSHGSPAVGHTESCNSVVFFGAEEGVTTDLAMARTSDAPSPQRTPSRNSFEIMAPSLLAYDTPHEDGTLPRFNRFETQDTHQRQEQNHPIQNSVSAENLHSPNEPPSKVSRHTLHVTSGDALCAVIPRDARRRERSPPLLASRTESREPSPAWVPWASDAPATARAASQHGDACAPDATDTSAGAFAGLGFPLFFRDVTSPPATHDERAPWFAFLSLSPSTDDQHCGQSYVTMPCSDRWDETQTATPKDVRYASRLALLSVPCFRCGGASGARLDGGEALTSDSSIFEIDTEPVTDRDSAAPQRTPSRARFLALPTIEEATSESHRSDDSTGTRVCGDTAPCDDSAAAQSCAGTTVCDESAATQSLTGTTADTDSAGTRTYVIAKPGDRGGVKESFAGTMDKICSISNENAGIELILPTRDTQDSGSVGGGTSDLSMEVATSDNQGLSRLTRQSEESRDRAPSRVDFSPYCESPLPRVDFYKILFNKENPSVSGRGSKPHNSAYPERTPLDHTELNARLPSTAARESEFQHASECFTSNREQNTLHQTPTCSTCFKHTRNSKHLRTRSNERREYQVPVKEHSEATGIQPDAFANAPATTDAAKSNIPLSFCIKSRSHGTVHRLFSGTDIHQSAKKHTLHIPRGNVTESSHYQTGMSNQLPLESNHPQLHDGSRPNTSYNYSADISLNETAFNYRTSNSKPSNSRVEIHDTLQCKPVQEHHNTAKDCSSKTHKAHKVHKKHSPTSDHSLSKVTPRNRVEKEIFEQRIKQKSRSRSVTQSISNVYAILHTEATESMNESETQSENSCDINGHGYETEDSYETDLPSVYQHPIHVSMQCMETFECHTKQCQRLHW